MNNLPSHFVLNDVLQSICCKSLEDSDLSNYYIEISDFVKVKIKLELSVLVTETSIIITQNPLYSFLSKADFNTFQIDFFLFMSSF